MMTHSVSSSVSKRKEIKSITEISRLVNIKTATMTLNLCTAGYGYNRIYYVTAMHHRVCEGYVRFMRRLCLVYGRVITGFCLVYEMFMSGL